MGSHIRSQRHSFRRDIESRHKKRLTSQKPNYRRGLRMEQLEDRTLLSISPFNFAATETVFTAPEDFGMIYGPVQQVSSIDPSVGPQNTNSTDFTGGDTVYGPVLDPSVVDQIDLQTVAIEEVDEPYLPASLRVGVEFSDSFEDPDTPQRNSFNVSELGWEPTFYGDTCNINARNSFDTWGVDAPDGDYIAYGLSSIRKELVERDLPQACHGTASIDLACYNNGSTMFRVYSSDGRWAEIGSKAATGAVWWGRTDSDSWVTTDIDFNFTYQYMFEWNTAYLVVDEDGLRAYGNVIDEDHLILECPDVRDIKTVAFGDSLGTALWNAYDNLSVSGMSVLDMPTVSLAQGTYTSAQTTTISSSTPGATIRYTTDGTDPTETNGTIIASGGTVQISGPMTLKTRVWAPGEGTSAVKRVVYAWPTTIDDGLWYRDQELYTPLAMYQPQNLQRISEAGFNTVISGNENDPANVAAANKELLDGALNNGIGVQFHLAGKMRQDPVDLDGIEDIVIALRDHPAIAAWYLADEMSHHDVPVSSVQAAVNLIHSLDPNHPVVGVDDSRVPVETYAPYFDSFAADVYVIDDPDDRPITLVEAYCDVTAGAISNGAAYGTVLQANQQSNLVYPSADEIWNMAYQGLTAGVKSIGWYSDGYAISSGRWYDTYTPLAGALNEIMPKVASATATERHTLGVTDDSLFVSVFDGPDGTMLVAANAGSSTRTINVNRSVSGVIEVVEDTNRDASCTRKDASTVTVTVAGMGCGAWMLEQETVFFESFEDTADPQRTNYPISDNGWTTVHDQSGDIRARNDFGGGAPGYGDYIGYTTADNPSKMMKYELDQPYYGTASVEMAVYNAGDSMFRVYDSYGKWVEIGTKCDTTPTCWGGATHTSSWTNQTDISFKYNYQQLKWNTAIIVVDQDGLRAYGDVIDEDHLILTDTTMRDISAIAIGDSSTGAAWNAYDAISVKGTPVLDNWNPTSVLFDSFEDTADPQRTNYPISDNGWENVPDQTGDIRARNDFGGGAPGYGDYIAYTTATNPSKMMRYELDQPYLGKASVEMAVYHAGDSMFRVYDSFGNWAEIGTKCNTTPTCWGGATSTASWSNETDISFDYNYEQLKWNKAIIVVDETELRAYGDEISPDRLILATSSVKNIKTITIGDEGTGAAWNAYDAVSVVGAPAVDDWDPTSVFFDSFEDTADPQRTNYPISDNGWIIKPGQSGNIRARNDFGGGAPGYGDYIAYTTANNPSQMMKYQLDQPYLGTASVEMAVYHAGDSMFRVYDSYGNWTEIGTKCNTTQTCWGGATNLTSWSNQTDISFNYAYEQLNWNTAIIVVDETGLRAYGDMVSSDRLILTASHMKDIKTVIIGDDGTGAAWNAYDAVSVVGAPALVFFDSFEDTADPQRTNYPISDNGWENVIWQSGDVRARNDFGGGSPGYGDYIAYTTAANPSKMMKYELDQPYYGTASVDMAVYNAGDSMFRVFDSEGNWAQIGTKCNTTPTCWGGGTNLASWTNKTDVSFSYNYQQLNWNTAYLVVDQDGLRGYADAIDGAHLVLTAPHIKDIKAIAIGDSSTGAAWNAYDAVSLRGTPRAYFFESFEDTADPQRTNYFISDNDWQTVPGQGGDIKARNDFGGGAPGYGDYIAYSLANYPGNFMKYDLGTSYQGTASVKMSLYEAGRTMFRVYDASGNWAEIGTLFSNGSHWDGRTDESSWVNTTLTFDYTYHSLEWNTAIFVVDGSGLKAYANVIDQAHLILTDSSITNIASIAIGDSSGGETFWNAYDAIAVYRN